MVKKARSAAHIGMVGIHQFSNGWVEFNDLKNKQFSAKDLQVVEPH
jgi:hypothetical protein